MELNTDSSDQRESEMHLTIVEDAVRGLIGGPFRVHDEAQHIDVKPNSLGQVICLEKWRDASSENRHVP
jgi:hypothetical protein